MSQFQTGYTYTTVMKIGGKFLPVPLSIPPRLLIWLTSADSAPDDQIESRQYPCDVDTDEKHSQAVSKAIAERRSSRRVKFEVDFGIQVARYILGRIADHF